MLTRCAMPAKRTTMLTRSIMCWFPISCTQLGSRILDSRKALSSTSSSKSTSPLKYWKAVTFLSSTSAITMVGIKPIRQAPRSSIRADPTSVVGVNAELRLVISGFEARFHLGKSKSGRGETGELSVNCQVN